MIGFEFDKEKAVNAVLYILKRVGGKADYHKLFKILYFSEGEHLKKYGRPVTGDSYIPMDFGPVPSYIYDILKAVATQGNPFFDYADYAKLFKISRENGKPIVEAISDADMDELSESDIEAIEKSISENSLLSFEALTKKSHDMAYEQARQNADDISYFNIAIASGADEKMIAYLMATHIPNNLT